MYKYFLLFFFNFIFINSQTIKGKIYDSIDRNSVSYASLLLMNDKGTYSDENGNYELNIRNSIYDTLKVSSLGFEPKFIPLLPFRNKDIIDLDISLSPKITQIEEVILSGKKLDYNRSITMGEAKEGNISMTSLIGYETCLFFENPEKIRGLVKRVYIDLKKRKNAQHIALFSIKFYEKDSLNNKPGKELYSQKIYVQPDNKKYRLWINVKDYFIEFPKNGIYLGVELINTQGKVEKYTRFGPSFRYTVSENTKSTTWTNYHNKGWFHLNFKTQSPKSNKTGFANPMFGLEVLYPSNKK